MPRKLPSRNRQPKRPPLRQFTSRLSLQVARELGLQRAPKITVTRSVDDYTRRLNGVQTGRGVRYRTADDLKKMGEVYIERTRGSARDYLVFILREWGASIPGQIGVTPNAVVAHTIGHVLYDEIQRREFRVEPRRDISQAFAKIVEIDYLMRTDPELATLRLHDVSHNTLLGIPLKLGEEGLNSDRLASIFFSAAPDAANRAELKRQLARQKFERFEEAIEFVREFGKKLKEKERN